MGCEVGNKKTSCYGLGLSKKLPNVDKKVLKNDKKNFTGEMPNNLGRQNAATCFKKLPKSNKSPNLVTL